MTVVAVPAPRRYPVAVVRCVVTTAAAVAFAYCWVWGSANGAAILRAWPELSTAARWGYPAQVLVMLLLTGGAALLALALAWLAEDRADSRALAICLGLLAFGPAADTLAAGVVHPLLGDAARDATYFVRDLAMVLATAALVRFTALFPRPLRPADLGPGPLRAVRLAFLDERRVWRAGIALGVAIPGAILLVEHLVGRAAGRRLLPILVAVGLAGLTLAVAYLRTPRPALDAADLRRRDWVLQGFVAATVVLLLASSVKVVQMLGGYAPGLPGWYIIALALGLDLLVVFLAVAMFYHGAFDPRLAIRRTAVAGLVGTLLVFVFVGVEQLLEETVQRWLGLGDRAGGILTGGVVALSFEPLKRRMDALVGRLLRRGGGPPPPAALRGPNGPQ